MNNQAFDTWVLENLHRMKTLYEQASMLANDDDLTVEDTKSLLADIADLSTAMQYTISGIVG